MTNDQKNNLVRFIRKFECCYNQIKVRGLHPSMDQWNLTTDSNGIIKIKHNVARYSTNPLSLMLVGRNMDKSLYGTTTRSHEQYLRIEYPYAMLAKIFYLPDRTLSPAFYEGFSNNRHYRNVYATDNKITEYGFDIGRHLMSKYFGIHLPYKQLDWF